MRRLIAVTAALLVVGSGSAYGATMLGASTATVESQDNIVTRTAIIRLGSSVYLHTNSTHGSVGVRRIALVNRGCDIQITWDGRLPGEKVLAATVEEDETVSRRGVQAGYSGNVTTGVIQMWRNGKKVCARDRRFGRVSNLWITLTSHVPEAQQEEETS